MHTFMEHVRADGLTKALSDRDGVFGDYRTAEQQPKAPT
jgi:hypothetical protein